MVPHPAWSRPEAITSTSLDEPFSASAIALNEAVEDSVGCHLKGSDEVSSARQEHDRSLGHVFAASKPLTEIKEGGKFLVDSVSDQDALLLKQLKAHGITPGAHLQVTSPSQEEFVLRTSSTSKALRLSRTLAGAVRIRSAD